MLRRSGLRWWPLSMQQKVMMTKDRDNLPLTREDFKRMKRIPRVKTLRRALDLSQVEFSRRFHIPLGTLRDWEQGRGKPDKAARCYLKVIAHRPRMVDKILNGGGNGR
jgi:putative transcriptional regulator